MLKYICLIYVIFSIVFKMDNKVLGKKVKNLRIKNDLTLDDLAQRSDLSKGFLSQLERGLTSPALDTFHDILIALGTNFASFFNEPLDNKKLYKEKSYPINKEKGYNIEWIVSDGIKNNLEPIRLTIKPGQESLELNPFEGEHFIYNLQGSGKVMYLDKEYEIAAGDTFYSAADSKLKIKNNGSKNLKVIWITTPPFF